MTPFDPRLIGPQRPGTVGPRPAAPGPKAPSQPGNFQRAFESELARNSVKFSAHAQHRLSQTRTQLTPDQMQKLKDAVDRAEQKGAHESLILMDNLALVVSIKNRTVITAVDGERIKENIFTNIDSAVIV